MMEGATNEEAFFNWQQTQSQEQQGSARAMSNSGWGSGCVAEEAKGKDEPGYDKPTEDCN